MLVVLILRFPELRTHAIQVDRNAHIGPLIERINSCCQKGLMLDTQETSCTIQAIFVEL